MDGPGDDYFDKVTGKHGNGLELGAPSWANPFEVHVYHHTPVMDEEFIVLWKYGVWQVRRESKGIA